MQFVWFGFLKHRLSLIGYLLFLTMTSAYADGVIHRYQVTQQQGMLKQSHIIEQWRTNQDKVLFYPHSQVVEHWSKSSANKTDFFRHFLAHHYSVFYSNDEMRALQKNTDWKTVGHFFSPQWLSHLTPQICPDSSSSTLECYQGQWGDRRVSVQWLAEESKLQQLQIRGQFQSITYQYMSSEPWSHAHQQAMEQWTRFSSIDYADIGDEEDDPILSQLIAQGFIYTDDHRH